MLKPAVEIRVGYIFDIIPLILTNMYTYSATFCSVIPAAEL